VEPRSRRSGSGRLPGEQTRARALHRIGQSQSSSDPPKLDSIMERRRRKEALQARGGKPVTSPRESARIKMPLRKPPLESAARVNADEDGARGGVPSSFWTMACPKSPRSPRGPTGPGPARSAGEESSSDLRKRALVLLASSMSAAVKEKTETFIQKHKIAFVHPDGPPDPDTTRQCEDELAQTATAPPQTAETAQRCLPLDALTFVWLQSVLQWGIQCVIGCMLLSLRCCLGSMNCLKPFLEEAPRRRYQDKPAVRTRPEATRPRRRGAAKGSTKDSLSEQLDTLEALLSREAASLVSLKAEKT